MTRLYATVDIFDEIVLNKGLPDRDYIRALFQYLKGIGVQRVDWVVDDVWSIYENYPLGFDLLAETVNIAHELGLELHAVYKPFEGVLDAYFMPHVAPQPAAAPVWNDLRGLLPVVRPFVTEHPEFCLQLRPDIVDRGLPITAIHLVDESDEPLNITADDITLRTGSQSGDLHVYAASLDVIETTETRTIDGVSKPCRIVKISNLALPAAHTHIDIAINHVGSASRSITNKSDAIVELIDESGSAVTFTIGNRSKSLIRWQWLALPVMRQIVAWCQTPEADAFLSDQALLDSIDDSVFFYDHQVRGGKTSTQQQGGITLTRGRARYLPGTLHPIYPEVREHWLDRARFCLDRGVDGIDYRSTFHLRPQYSDDYGFNPPVLEATNGSTELDDIQRVLRESYTQFLREAASLIHERGKQMGVHLLGAFNEPADVQAGVKNLLPGIGRDWRTWCTFADYATFRGSPGANAQTMQRVVEPMAAECAQAGTSFTLQSARLPLVGMRKTNYRLTDKSRSDIEGEMQLVSASPHMDAYQLYETASFTGLDESGRLTCSDDLAELARENFPRSRTDDQ